MTNIWVPKMKMLEPNRSIMVPARLVGLFKLDAIRPDGRRRPLTGWFPNIITNNGLNRIGTVADYLAACRVGSGSATPAATDTALQSQIAGTDTIFSSGNAAQASPPYYASHTRVYRFAAGVAAGNLQEIGIATQAAAGGVLFSRALILDGSGNPTTVTVLADEVLDATYQCRLYPPLSDVTGSVVISSVNYNYTVRAMSVNDNSFWCLPAHAGGGGLNSCRFGDGAIGATIVNAPTGSSELLHSTPGSYSDGTLARQNTTTAGLTEANFAGGVDWASQCFGTPGGNSALGTMQVGFSPAIPKNNTMTLSLVFEVAWARGTI